MSEPSSTPPVALTIAGSDSGGGAGIQADLRTFAFHRVHGTCAITCVTAQNTLGVTRVDALAPEAVVAQIEAVASDIGVDAAKTGMLLRAEIIEAVAGAVERLGIDNLVVDPVMVARTGDRLIDETAVAAVRDLLLPLARIVTPNRHEARILAGHDVESLDDMRSAARAIAALGAPAVLVKGGGMAGRLRGVDVLATAAGVEVIETRTVETTNTHGTGCTLSAAIAANLALGHELEESVRRAKAYVTAALEHALDIGGGQGPVGHWHALDND